jgi:SAM-dependent methyltransferase
VASQLWPPTSHGQRFTLDSDSAQNAAFHDRLAPQYDARMASSAFNALAREAFVELVSRYICPGSELLDFGCGTGIDALQYARKGYRVQAYDNSPGMLGQLQLRCKGEVASGQIIAWSEDYPSFLDRFPQPPAPSAAVANFAVLNSIRELAPLFETFARNLAPPGWMILSILNPLHWSKLKKSGWWLRSRDQHGGSPVYTVQPYATYMHFVSHLLRAAPQFHLVGCANSGRFVRYKSTTPENEQSWWELADSKKKRMQRILWRTPAYRLLGQFVFLVLRRDP